MTRGARTQNRTPTFDKKLLHLLNAAAGVFAEEGYERASMRRIAAEADVSLAGIYHYVAKKEEILFLIQLHSFESLFAGLEERLKGLSDPRQRLLSVVENHVGHFVDHMNELKVCARELETLTGEAYDTVKEKRLAYFRQVRLVVEGLCRDQEANLDPWLATANLFGMLNWFYQWYDPARHRVSPDELAAQQAALFLDGYLSASTRRRDIDDGEVPGSSG